MVNECLEVAAFCLTGAILAVLLRQYCSEQSMLLALGVCCIVSVVFFTTLSPVVMSITVIFENAGLSDSYVSLIFKAVAICFITEIASGICRDSGETAIASAAEMWGRGAIAAASLPVIEVLIESITIFFNGV